MAEQRKIEKIEISNEKAQLLAELARDADGNIVIKNEQLKELLGRNLEGIEGLGDASAATKVSVGVDF